MNKTEQKLIDLMGRGNRGRYSFCAGLMRASTRAKLYPTNVRMRKAAFSLRDKGIVTVSVERNLAQGEFYSTISVARV